jgi:uncharacterized protein (TIGR03437 family)
MRTLSAGILLSISFAHAQQYALFTFDPPGSTSTTVTGINNAGQIVGYYEDASGFHGFLRTGSTYTIIEVPDSIPGRTLPAGISNRGEITGQFANASGTHGFIRSADGNSYTVFDAPNLGAGATSPQDINDSGAVIGNGFAGAGVNDGFLRSPQGSFTTLQLGTNVFPAGINNAGEIAGEYRSGGSSGFLRGFVRSVTGTYQAIDVPGIIGTQIVDISDNGLLAGRFGNSSLFVRNTDGTFVTFTGPDSPATPAGINDSGTVAGSHGGGPARHGFLAVPSNSAPRPAIRSERGVISAFGYGGYDAISPGTWIEIYGTNLSKTTRQWAAADFNGNAAPTSLDGVTVRISGQPAFIYYVSPGQINAQVPSTVAPGAVTVVVFSDGQSSAAYPVQVNPIKPGLLTFPQVRLAFRDAVAIFPDNVTYALTPNSAWPVPSRLAHAGDTLTLYGIGFGPVTPAIPAGQIATQAATLPGSLRIFFNGVPGIVTYAGLAPGYVGLYQFNVIVPAGAGQSSNSAVVSFDYEGANGFQSTGIGLEP